MAVSSPAQSLEHLPQGVVAVPAALQAWQPNWQTAVLAGLTLAATSLTIAGAAALRAASVQPSTALAQAGAGSTLPPWLAALGKVLLGALIGVVALAALAALIYAIAAALVIAGVILAVGYVVWEFWTRLQAFRAVRGAPGCWDVVQLAGVSLLNLVGVVSIYEGLTGRQVLTGLKLSMEARWEAVLGGALQLGLTFVGVRVGLRALFRRGAREPIPAQRTPTEPRTGQLPESAAGDTPGDPPGPDLTRQQRLEEARRQREVQRN